MSNLKRSSSSFKSQMFPYKVEMFTYVQSSDSEQPMKVLYWLQWLIFIIKSFCHNFRLPLYNSKAFKRQKNLSLYYGFLLFPSLTTSTHLVPLRSSSNALTINQFINRNPQIRIFTLNCIRNVLLLQYLHCKFTYGLASYKLFQLDFRVVLVLRANCGIGSCCI